MAKPFAFEADTHVKEDTPVVKPEWGLKRICPHCGAKYYDFNKETPTCPKCGKPFDAELSQRTRTTKAGGEEAKKAKEEAAKKSKKDDKVEIDGKDDGLIEDASELDDDDMSDVVDVEPKDKDD